MELHQVQTSRLTAAPILQIACHIFCHTPRRACQSTQACRESESTAQRAHNMTSRLDECFWKCGCAKGSRLPGQIALVA